MARIKLKKPKPKYHIEVDWVAYYLDFEHEHGGCPMQLEDERKLLFRDGWRYNAFNHAGPEYPPPEDKQKRLDLQELYWTLKKRIIDRELWECRCELQRLREVRAVRSLPIKEKPGKIEVIAESLDDGYEQIEDDIEIHLLITDKPFTARIALLQSDRGECLTNLDRIAKDRNSNGQTQDATAGN
jgi:hypothetical protein